MARFEGELARADPHAPDHTADQARTALYSAEVLRSVTPAAVGAREH